MDANKISDTLTVSIVSVNGMDAKTAGQRGRAGLNKAVPNKRLGISFYQ